MRRRSFLMNREGFRIGGSPLCAVLLLSACAGPAHGQYHTYWGDVHGHTALSDGKGAPRIVVDVKGTAPIEEAVIVRNGEVIHTLRSQKENVSFAYVDETFAGPSYYYVRVIQADTDPHGNHSHAWSSPIWVMQRR